MISSRSCSEVIHASTVTAGGFAHISPAPPRHLHHEQARLAQATPLPLLPPSSSSAEAGGSSGLSLQARLGELPVLLGLLLAREARLLRALQEVMRGGGRDCEDGNV